MPAVKRHRWSDGRFSYDAKECEAAVVIQNAWTCTFAMDLSKQRAQRYLKICPTPEKTKSMMFEDLAIFVREKSVIDLTRRCLIRVHFASLVVAGNEIPPSHINVRIFLASYMIAFKPSHVFESMKDKEKELLAAATLMLDAFHTILHRLVSKGSFQSIAKEVLASFSKLLHGYLCSFKNWKNQDEERLVCRIKHALVALYHAKATLPSDEPEDSAVSLEIRTQVERLRGKLLQIRGPGVLVEFEASQASLVAAIAKENDCLHSSERTSNEQLAHELLLDPAFQIDDNGDHHVDVAASDLRDQSHEQFWPSLEADFRSSVPCYVRVLRVLSDIKDTVGEHAGGGDKAAIEEIDLVFIAGQLEREAFSVMDCKKLLASLASILRRVHHPNRHAEMDERWGEVSGGMASGDQAKALCTALRFLHRQSNLLYIDAANARLRCIAPVIKDHGIEYERDKFQKKLDDGSVTLDRTRAWITDAVRRETQSGEVQLKALRDGSASAYVGVHISAVMSLVSGREALRSDNTPEIIRLDIARLALAQREFNRIVDRATLLVMISHGMHVDGDVIPDKKQAFYSTVPAVNMKDNDFENIVGCFGALVLHAGMTAESKDILFRDVTEAVDNKDSRVRQLIVMRVCDVWADCMRTGAPNSKFIRSAVPVLPLIKAAAQRLAGCTRLNRTVHSETYNRLIGEAVAKLAVGDE